MVIWLSNDCYIKADDGICFELVKRHKRKQGNNVGTWAQTTLGYYSSLGAAAKGALTHAILNKKEEGTVKEMLVHIEQIEQQILEACRTVGAASQAASIEGAFRPEELESLLFFGDEQ